MQTSSIAKARLDGTILLKYIFIDALIFPLLLTALIMQEAVATYNTYQPTSYAIVYIYTRARTHQELEIAS
jgi:hypothetical protein